MENSKLNSKKTKKRTVNSKKVLVTVAFLCIISLVTFWVNNRKMQTENLKITPEIARSKEYEKVKAGDEKTNTEFVEFDAFFLKDLDGDENADAIRGACNEIGKTDTLYMDLKVLNNGYFKDGLITINASNFKLSTTLVKDSIIAQNYISSDTKTIKLNQMQNGSQKLITGLVDTVLNNDISNYSKINSVTLTGTHVTDDGKTTEINKTINFNVDWYGTTKASIVSENIKNQVDELNQLVDGNNINLKFDLKTGENNNQLILKSTQIEGTIPELNGYKPTSFVIEGDNITSTYDAETGIFTAKREATLESQIVTKAVETSSSNKTRYNTYTVKLTYPKEAYENMEENDLELLIPLKTWYEGYNNPNDEFENPYISNIAETTVVARWVKYSGNAYRLDITVENYQNNNHIISKEKPLKIYNNISEAEKEDYYLVKWSLTTGKTGNSSSVILKETENGKQQVSDQFIKKDASKESMENLTTNIGIYFVGSNGMLGENGWIKVYNDETNELIETFTKDNWNQYATISKFYHFSTPIKHIRVETSATNAESDFKVYNIKELDDKYITENYTKEEFDKLEHIRSTLTGYYGGTPSTVRGSAEYEEPYSRATINVEKKELSTQETVNDQVIEISAKASKYNEEKWKNGTFLVEIPKEIIDMKINSVTVSNENVKIIGYDLSENDGKYFVKILTENEEPEEFDIRINCTMTPDPSSTTVSRDVDLYAINEYCTNYYQETSDKYDIDEDLNREEIINIAKTDISLISPNELITSQIATNYDQEKNITVAPKVAKVKKSQRTANIEVNVTNNYNQDITDVVIQGVIPFKDNKFVIGNTALNSTFSTYMSNTGIQLPENLKDKATIYYSTQEKPTNDIKDSANKWQTADKVTNWEDIKTYIIDFGEYTFSGKDSFKYVYEVNLPEGVEYNEVTYSEHAIYFSLLTDAGKYSTYTAANKLGLMIAKQYDLEIEKFQQNTSERIQGVTFSVTEEGQDESKIRVTNNNGKLTVEGLFAERSYIIKEIRTTEDYVLNEEEIKIYTYTDEQDKLYIKYKNEDGTYSNLEDKYEWLINASIEKNENEDYKAKISLENEVRPRLKITKLEKETGRKQELVRFSVEGKNVNQMAFTNSNGELSIKGLYLNEEYTIKELSNKGYYLIEPIKFKVLNNNGVYSAQILEGNVKNTEVKEVDYIPEIDLTLENEKIPTYNLEITKIEEGTSGENIKVLKDAEFLLKGEDDNSQRKLTTDRNGTATINDLYQHIDGKSITGKYTLKETKAPSGYVSNGEEINFTISKNGEEKLEANIENEDNLTSLKSVEIEGNTVKITIQDKPLFKLTKTDKETGEKLKGAKFVIYEVSEDGTELDFAKDVNGNYVGELNKKNQYEIVTGNNGEVTLPLRNGTYKAIEIEAPEGYEDKKIEYVFKISGNEDEEEIGTPDEYTDTLEINYIEDLVDLAENVRNGTTYSGTKVILKRTLDFTDSASYKDPSDKSKYGDYNLDGNVEDIKTELTTGIGFRSIGYYNEKPFSGIFDGQNNEIKGMHIDYTADAPAKTDNNVNLTNPALFGYVKNGKIKNIGTSGNVKGIGYPSGLVSRGDNIEIYNCYNQCNIEGSGSSTGILNMALGNVTIKKCYNKGKIQGGSNSSGILGLAVGSTFNIAIEKCQNSGEIECGGTTCGSIVGLIDNVDSTKINSCDNNADLKLGQDSGAIFGYIRAKNVNIENCNNNGNMSFNWRSGGIGGNLIPSENAKIINCNNYGDLKQVGNGDRVGGILTESQGGKIEFINCSNYGDIYSNGSLIGGICGETNSEGEFESCFNYGNIYGSSNVRRQIGGIIGYGNKKYTIRECGNYGTIFGGLETGGIAGYITQGDSNIEDTFNKGDVYVEKQYLAGICPWAVNVKNSYSTGKLHNLTPYEIQYVYTIAHDDSNISNSYYIYDINNLNISYDGRNTGTQVTEEEIGSREFFDKLNVDNVWIYRENESPALKIPATNAREITELNVENKSKYFNITTDIEEINGTKGGSISGEDEVPYEKVKYDKDSTKEIKITPDDGYKIVKITINDKDYEFTPNQDDGTYTLPLFENMKEDKHIVVSFATEEQIFTINKVDKETGKPLAGAEFKVVRKEDITDSESQSKTYITDSNGQIKMALAEGEYEITETKAPEEYILNSNPIEFTFDANNKSITIENTKKPIILVNHYLWTETQGTTEEKLAQSEKYTGNNGDAYSTNPNFKIEYEIITNKDYYKGKTESEILSILEKVSIQDAGYSNWNDFYNDYYIPTNSSGKYTDETQVIDYYYKEKIYKLTVKHLLEGTEENVPSKTGGTVEDEITEGYKKDEQYETEKSNKVDYTKYELIETPENAEGTIVEDTEVRYYYRQKDSAGVIVHHYIVGTETKVPNNTEGEVQDERLPVAGTVKVGDEYTSQNASDRIATNYRVATNKDVYGNEIPTELEGKENEIYTPKNAIGKYKEEVQVVTYYYILETPIYTNTITKTGTESISKEDESVRYNISYNVEIQDYKGNATVTIVDNLPYKIDVSKSSLNGGQYNERDNTITWKDMIRNIDTYINEESGRITITKSINVVYSNLDYSKNSMTNIVTGNTLLITSNTYTDTVQDTVTTTYKFYKNITVNKEWEDNNNSLELRPTKVKVVLKAKNYEIPDTVQKQKELSGPNWTDTWLNLEKYDSAGKEIEYSVEEELENNLAIIYKPTITSTNDTFTIKNTYTEPTEKVNLVVNKTWEDSDNENGKRPEKVKLVVSKPVEQGGATKNVEVQNYELKVSENETSHTFTGLLKYDEKGNKINYIVEEKEVKVNDLYFYEMTGGQVTEKETSYEANIVNTFKVSDEKIQITVNKEWEDNNDENGKRPEKVKFVVSKPVEQGGVTENVEVQSYELKVSENEESHTFTDLLKYDEKGNEINYIISEEEVNANDLQFYTKRVVDVSKYNYKVINTFTVPGDQIEIIAKKVWDDEENVARKRPTSVTIKLMDGTNEISSDIANEANGWQVTFSNIAKYDSKGREINYTVKEEETAEKDLYFYSDGEITGNKDNGFEIKNTFEVPNDTIEITATKQWNDNNKGRLKNIIFVLEGNNKTYRHTLSESNKDTENSWVYTFKNLPKYDSKGNEIIYTLREESQSNDLKKYISQVEGNKVTNTLIVKDTKIEKTGTNKITSLEDKIEYSLKYTVSIDSSYTQGVTYTIVDNLPYEIDTSKEYDLDGGIYDSAAKTITWTDTYNNENEIIKNVSLVYKNIDISKTTITNNVKGTLKLNNGYEEEKTAKWDTIVDFTKKITVKKEWKGDYKANDNGTLTISNSRPTEVTVELNSIDDNNKITKLQQKKVNASNKWQVTFNNLPKYDATTRKEIKYTVTENNVPAGYYRNIKQEGDNFVITNSKYGSIKITKVDSADNSKKLGGAEFKLEKLKEVNGRKEIDENFATQTATSSTEESKLGQFEFKNLEYGTYRLTETKAPEGYKLSKNTIDIEITPENIDYVGGFSNRKKIALPKTGEVGRYVLILSGIFILIIIVMIKKKRIYIVRQ